MILLGLGTNIGNRQENILTALQLLNKVVKILQVSSLYETEPVGFKNQPQFLNIVVSIDTTLSPMILLQKCLEIEEEMGRKRLVHWGPRLIDIDILTYKNETVNEENLKIPHPFLAERKFVLIPIAELNEKFCLQGKSIATLLKDCPDKTTIEMYKDDISKFIPQI